MSEFGRVEGLEHALRVFDEMPQNAVKIVRTSLREASKVTRKQMKLKMPSRFQRLVAYRVKRFANQHELSAMVGLFKGKDQKRNRKEVSDWFKAYWKNYGTSKRRDPAHQFDYPLRHDRDATKRNKEGQYPERFFEAAIRGWETIFMDAFNASLKEQEDKFYGR